MVGIIAPLNLRG